MRILVTGADGQLGRALRAVLAPIHECLWADLPDLDVRELAALRDLVRGQRPQAILHLAAVTRVDDCETDPDETFAVNAVGTRNVALAAREIGAQLLFISTDYVFDGRQQRPYREYDTPEPLNIYGWSKLHGERVVRDLVREHYIVRTSGLFGPGGASFVSAILAAQAQEGEIRVVADQICRPTYAGHLATAIARILGSANYGILHVASTGEVSWYDFARAILTAAGRDANTVVPIASDELQRPARRPAYSVLDTRAYEAIFAAQLPPWEEGLAAYLQATAEGGAPEGTAP